MGQRKDKIDGQSLSLKQRVKSDIKAAQKLWMPWWGVLLWMAFCLPVIVLSDRVGRLGMSLPLLNCIAVFALLIYLKRQLSRQVRFWGHFGRFPDGPPCAGHLVCSVTTRWVPALAIATISSVDFCLMLWILDAVGRLDGRTFPRQAAS